MLRGFFGNLIFAIIARMLCGNHLNILAKYINVLMFLMFWVDARLKEKKVCLCTPYSATRLTVATQQTFFTS